MQQRQVTAVIQYCSALVDDILSIDEPVMDCSFEHHRRGMENPQLLE